MTPSDEQAGELLEALVRTPSVSGAERAASELLVARMRELGFTHAEVDAAGNAVGHMGDGPRRLVLLGHIDTVPGEVPVRREGDLLYGRGAVDAKGPLVAFTCAAARAGVREGWTVTVVGAVEEEAPTSKGARHVAPLWRPEACVIGEPSGWDALTLGYKGRTLVRHRRAQPVGHSAGPERAVAEHGVELWNALFAKAEALNRAHERVVDQLTPSLLAIQTSSDGLHEAVELKISWRTPPWFELEPWLLAARELAAPGELELLESVPAHRDGSRTPLVRAFLPAIRAQGGTPRFKQKTGTSDMNVVGPAWGCPILAYGPGDSTLDHTPHEHVDLNELARSVAVLTTAIERLCAAS